MNETFQPLPQKDLERVLVLQNAALERLRRQGEWQEVEGYPGLVRSYCDESLMMLHRTPFQPPPVSDAAVAAGVSPTVQRHAARAYGLDIWFCKRKVFSLVWNTINAPQIVLFKSGAWESFLLRNG